MGKRANNPQSCACACRQRDFETRKRPFERANHPTQRGCLVSWFYFALLMLLNSEKRDHKINKSNDRSWRKYCIHHFAASAVYSAHFSSFHLPRILDTSLRPFFQLKSNDLLQLKSILSLTMGATEWKLVYCSLVESFIVGWTKFRYVSNKQFCARMAKNNDWYNRDCMTRTLKSVYQCIYV